MLFLSLCALVLALAGRAVYVCTLNAVWDSHTKRKPWEPGYRGKG